MYMNRAVVKSAEPRGETSIMTYYDYEDDFYTHTVQYEIGQRSIKFKGCRLWNNLPAEIKIIQSFSSFKYNF